MSIEISWEKEFTIVDRETPKSLMERRAFDAACMPGYGGRSEGLQDYLKRGGDPAKITDDMLPGRFFIRLPEDERWLLSKLKPEDTIGPGLWFINAFKPMPEPRTMTEILDRHCPDRRVL